MTDTRTERPTVIVFGSVNVDLVCRVPAIARPGETVLSARYEQLNGGKGANQAVAARRSSALPVAFAGAVGDDDLGRGARRSLDEEGIDTADLATAGERTGCAFIAIDEAGENAITVASGANLEADASGIDPSRFHEAAVLVLQMEIPRGENLAAAKRMRAAGGRVVVNLAPVPTNLRQDELAEILAASTVLVVNETELASAAMISQVVGEASAAMADRLARRFAITVIATLGAGGVLIADGGGKTTHVAALPVDVVDTTGAGDTFVGVFASGLAEGLSIADAARRAAVGASLACRKVGAQTAMPSVAEIDAALAGA
ncbi:ribokinase [Jiella avicenniae]|uniref:Ribokinase n=1 Tax=Jiella avicenniae TaxID=2907202 RepID=A0A9X1T404_9HYPH|nr:ribokinase [Jiella avicenniae]MCE7027402.1 ribokinase [Jiella avicenniae]